MRAQIIKGRRKEGKTDEIVNKLGRKRRVAKTNAWGGKSQDLLTVRGNRPINIVAIVEMKKHHSRVNY